MHSFSDIDIDIDRDIDIIYMYNVNKLYFFKEKEKKPPPFQCPVSTGLAGVEPGQGPQENVQEQKAIELTLWSMGRR